MIEITAEIRALIDKAAAGVELAGDEYIDPADGLIHCKSRHTRGRPLCHALGNPATLCRAASASASGAEERRKVMKNGELRGAYQTPKGTGLARPLSL